MAVRQGAGSVTVCTWRVFERVCTHSADDDGCVLGARLLGLQLVLVTGAQVDVDNAGGLVPWFGDLGLGLYEPEGPKAAVNRSSCLFRGLRGSGVRARQLDECGLGRVVCCDCHLPGLRMAGGQQLRGGGGAKVVGVGHRVIDRCRVVLVHVVPRRRIACQEASAVGTWLRGAKSRRPEEQSRGAEQSRAAEEQSRGALLRTCPGGWAAGRRTTMPEGRRASGRSRVCRISDCCATRQARGGRQKKTQWPKGSDQRARGRLAQPPNAGRKARRESAWGWGKRARTAAGRSSGLPFSRVLKIGRKHFFPSLRASQ